MSCALCHIRKEKRFCPAVHGRICPTCCGEQREVTLDCPGDCSYLQQARRNELPRSLEASEPELLFPDIEVPQQFLYEREPLVVGMSFAIAKAARLDRGLVDRDAISSLHALAKSYQTLVNSGLVYEQPTAAMAQQNLIAEMQKMIAEYRDMEQKHLGYPTLRDSEALKGVVFLLRMALARTTGRPRSRAFLDFLFEQFPEKSGVVTPAQEPSRIIVP
ncbi:MAG TPA: hypothetical protein VFU76_16400 [Terriglobales bacterium]|nr:hypothetical protein [Terriglobales bacterium]